MPDVAGDVDFSSVNRTAVVVISSAAFALLTCVEIEADADSVSGVFTSDKMTEALAVAPTAITANATISLWRKLGAPFR
jgi:hypothetical protein